MREDQIIYASKNKMPFLIHHYKSLFIKESTPLYFQKINPKFKQTNVPNLPKAAEEYASPSSFAD